MYVAGSGARVRDAGSACPGRRSLADYGEGASAKVEAQSTRAADTDNGVGTDPGNVTATETDHGDNAVRHAKFPQLPEDQNAIARENLHFCRVPNSMTPSQRSCH